MKRSPDAPRGAIAVWRWPNFSPIEFLCQCGECEEVRIHSKLLDTLEALREAFGDAIRINSGNRCILHNLSVGGASASKHLSEEPGAREGQKRKIPGLAADLSIRAPTPFRFRELYKCAHDLYPGGLGLYWHADEGKRFLHLDVRSGPQSRWAYLDSRPVDFATLVSDLLNARLS